MNAVELSIVIPCYKSESCLSKLNGCLINVLTELGVSYEIIYINDASPDNTWGILLELANNCKQVKAINLIKNYGQHNAVLCGFQYSKGQYVITMDDDLQNPPDQIPIIFNAIRNSNHDLIFGQFKEKRHPGYRKLGTRIISYLNSKVFNKPDNIVLSNFRIIHRSVIQRVLTYKTPYPYIPGLLLLHSSSIGNVMVKHDERTAGKSNYTFRKIFSLVTRLMFNYSAYPVRVLSFTGTGISFFVFLISIFIAIRALISSGTVHDWVVLTVVISLLCGIIIMLLGFLGEYLSRVLIQLSASNSYNVKEVINE